MNKVFVIYDSVFGNTEKVAQSIAAALGTKAIPVSHVETGLLPGLDLLVVFSPTRGFRPTEGISKLLNGLARRPKRIRASNRNSPTSRTLAGKEPRPNIKVRNPYLAEERLNG